MAVYQQQAKPWSLAFSLIVLSFLHHVAPVPMEDIERMAALCMKDLDEDGDDDGDLENDSDLLVRQNLLVFTSLQVAHQMRSFSQEKVLIEVYVFQAEWMRCWKTMRSKWSGTSSITSASSTLKCSARIPECTWQPGGHLQELGHVPNGHYQRQGRGGPAKHGDTTADWRWDISKIRAPPTSTFWWPMIVSRAGLQPCSWGPLSCRVELQP